MNGVESEEQIGKAFGDDLVLPATIVGIDALREGRVITYSKKGKIFFGELTGQKTRRVGRVGALFDRAGIAYEIPSDIRRTIWWKFMINVGVNQASAALRAPYGVFQTPGEARLLMESAMAEVIAVASRLGIPLGEADLADWYAVLKGMSPEGKTSMLQDVEAGRKTEVEMFAGKVIELGRRLGVPTPVNEKLFDLIRKIEAS
jgi:2-dehydropantoate 2-reductase